MSLFTGSSVLSLLQLAKTVAAKVKNKNFFHSKIFLMFRVQSYKIIINKQLIMKIFFSITNSIHQKVKVWL